MIILASRKQDRLSRKTEQLAATVTDKFKFISKLGDCILIHLNLDTIAPKYSYWLSMSRVDAERLRDALNTMLAVDQSNETT